jgi:hypothetical protein
MGAENESESKRSKAPPWPGIDAPQSLTPQLVHSLAPFMRPRIPQDAGGGFWPKSSKISRPVPWHEATFEGFSISGELAVFKSAQGDPVIVDVGTGTIAHIAAVPEIWGARRTEQAEEGGLFTPRESATKISEATKIRKKPSKKTRSNDYPVDDFGRSRGHNATVTSVCMAQNGRWEVTASHDGTARLWDVANDRPLAMFSSELGLSSCQWSPDSRTLAVIDSANRTHLLRVEGG